MTTTEYTDDAPVGTTIASVTRRRTPVRIPASRYTDPAWADARDGRGVAAYAWQLACSLDHVAEPGDWFEYTVGQVLGADRARRRRRVACVSRTCACTAATSCATAPGIGHDRDPLPVSPLVVGSARAAFARCPSRKGFGVLRNEDFPLVAVQVDTWGPFVFVNLDTDAHRCADYLAPVPQDCAWIGLDDFRCVARSTVPLPANWKVLHRGVQRDLSRAGHPSRDAADVRRRQLAAGDLGAHGPTGAALRVAVAAASRAPIGSAGVGVVHRSDGRPHRHRRQGRGRRGARHPRRLRPA